MSTTAFLQRQLSLYDSPPTRQTVEHLVLHATREPRRLGAIYQLVLAFRPGTAPETIRARVYEQVEAGRIIRLARGVYLAVDGPARLLMVTGDAWDLIKQVPDGAVNVTVADPPWLLGTEENARTGTTRPHKDQGRTYELRDLDEAFLRELYRVTSKEHEWASIAPRKCGACGGKIDKQTLQPKGLNQATTGYCPTCAAVGALAPQQRPKGGGACFIITPPRTAQTDTHIDALKTLAQTCGFVFQTEFAVDYEDKGMGYWPPQQHWLVHLFTAGPRAGVPHDLSVTSVIRCRRVRRASRKGHADAKREHEAEKPIELYDALLRFASQPGDIVLDPFGGRARWSRLAVAKGRHVVLFEKDPTWLERVATDDWHLPPEAPALEE